MEREEQNGVVPIPHEQIKYSFKAFCMSFYPHNSSIIMSVLAFFHCDKTPEIKSLKEKTFIWAQDFKGFSPRSFGSIGYGTLVKQNTMVGNVWQSKDVHLMVAS